MQRSPHLAERVSSDSLNEFMHMTVITTALTRNLGGTYNIMVCRICISISDNCLFFLSNFLTVYTFYILLQGEHLISTQILTMLKILTAPTSIPMIVLELFVHGGSRLRTQHRKKNYSQMKIQIVQEIVQRLQVHNRARKTITGRNLSMTTEHFLKQDIMWRENLQEYRFYKLGNHFSNNNSGAKVMKRS